MDISYHSKWPYPPYPYLDQVIKNCPKAAETYMWLWAHKDKNQKVKLTSSDVLRHTMQNRRTFVHNCVMLARQGVLDIEYDKDAIKVEVVGWQDEME